MEDFLCHYITSEEEKIERAKQRREELIKKMSEKQRLERERRRKANSYNKE